MKTTTYAFIECSFFFGLDSNEHITSTLEKGF